MKMKILIGDVIANGSKHLHICGNSLSHYQCENFEFHGSFFIQSIRNGGQEIVLTKN
jgi:hypothetical protein